MILRFIVELSANENIKVRPSKIVAGLEADKTNEFLQAIGKAIERKISSTEAVAAVKDGASAETVKPVKAVGKSKTEKSKETAQLTRKTSIDSNKKAENKTKTGTKVDGKNTTESKKSKPKVAKQSSVSKDDGQKKPKKTEEPVMRTETVSEQIHDGKDDEKEEQAVSR